MDLLRHFLWLLIDLEKGDKTSQRLRSRCSRVEANDGGTGQGVRVGVGAGGTLKTETQLEKCKLEYCFYYKANQLRLHCDAHQRCLRDG